MVLAWQERFTTKSDASTQQVLGAYKIHPVVKSDLKKISSKT